MNLIPYYKNKLESALRKRRSGYYVKSTSRTSSGLVKMDVWCNGLATAEAIALQLKKANVAVTGPYPINPPNESFSHFMYVYFDYLHGYSIGNEDYGTILCKTADGDLLTSEGYGKIPIVTFKTKTDAQIHINQNNYYNVKPIKLKL